MMSIVRKRKKKECFDAMYDAPYILLPIYPLACADFGGILAEVINNRAEKKPDEPMDLILCVNFMRATQRLRESILPHLKSEAMTFFAGMSGLAKRW